MAKELKFEAQVWELYEREIREAILGEGVTPRARAGVNTWLRDSYEQLEPYLEAQRTLALQKGIRASLERFDPGGGPEEAEEFEVELRKVREAMDTNRAKIAELEEEFKEKIRRVHMLRALRETLPPADEEDLPEPP